VLTTVPLLDFVDAQKALEDAASASNFSSLVLAGPRYAGKTRLLRETFVFIARSELVVYLDLEAQTGTEDLMRHLMATASDLELNGLREEVRKLVSANANFERTRIRNSQITLNNPVTAERLQYALSLSFRADLRRLQRKLVLILDHTYACDGDAAKFVMQIVSAMRTHNAGTVIVEQAIHDIGVAVIADGRDRANLVETISDGPHIRVEVPRFNANEISSFAQQLGVPDAALDCRSIAVSTGGVAGLVVLSLVNHREANAARHRVGEAGS
jgi:hypothetical protein